MAKQSQSTALKREITRCKKESANLWMAFSDVERDSNAIVSALGEISERLNRFDDAIRLVVEATEEHNDNTANPTQGEEGK